MKRLFVLIVAAFVASGCTAAQLEQIDPVVAVTGVTCPDRFGTPQDLISGFQCCPGGGQCEENLYCYAPDSCRGPLSPNDPYGARVSKKRSRF